MFIVGVLAIAAILVGLFVTWGFACSGRILDNTKYASGYSEKGFRSVRPGMNKNEVRAILGKPLREDVYGRETSNAVGGDLSAVEMWRYSLPGTFGWRHKEVHFNRQGKVVSTESRWLE